MGKSSNPGPSNSGMNEKTNPKFKWVRVLHVLEYHPWHQVKKLVPSKRHHNGRTNNGINISEPVGYEPYSVLEEENNENLQADENTCSIESCPMDTRKKNLESSTIASNKQAKSSRAKKLRKLIVKEVTKRSGKHRRSLTCPEASQQQLNVSRSHSHSHQELENDEVPTKTTKNESQKCELCTARRLECHLGNQDEQQIDQINTIFQEIKDVEITQIPNIRHNNLKRSISFQHSNEFLDALDVVSVNNHFFLRVLDEPEPSKQKWLKKSQTFSENRNQNQENNFGVGEKRFKTIGQKIRHLIRDSRKERRRIAMDAVLHKVPFGKKVSQEIPSSNDNIPISPYHTKDGKILKKQLSSLDQSMDRYTQLMHSTSFNRSSQIETSLERIKLRLMDENSYKCAPGNLRRILSSPNLNSSLTHLYDDYNGHSSSRTPILRPTSFNEQRVLWSVNLEGLEMSKSEEDKHSTMEDMSSNVPKDIRDSTIVDQQTIAPCDSGNDVKAYLFVVESNLLTNIPSLDGKISQEDLKPTQVDQVDTNEAEGTICSQFNSHPRIQVHAKDEQKFNYVKNILQVSGYSDTQSLGTWYSSEQPVDPSLLIELQPEFPGSTEGTQSNHLLLFDLINEVLLKIYERSISYWPAPLSSCSRTHPMPKGYHVLEEVWACITWYMDCSMCEAQQPSDYMTTRDLSKDDEWMNLQFDDECVALEIEDLIFQDLLNELVF